ncbi:Rha family phage regulatory protein, partial [Shigella flexneri]
MLNVAIENQNGWNYSASAPHKTGAGRGNPNVTRAHSRAEAVFLCVMHSSIQIMVGCAGIVAMMASSSDKLINSPPRFSTTIRVVRRTGVEIPVTR